MPGVATRVESRAGGGAGPDAHPSEKKVRHRGLMAAVLGRDEHGEVIRKAGVMSVVLAGGTVRPGDPIRVELPPEPHERLRPG
ncbi:hypothetical protein [Rugosimonospora acidiphila]|uniref:hypothetical protein n=1 Tax=Rugosimonospora acidiphila TaxID=556531 RepID=UPI0031E58E83